MENKTIDVLGTLYTIKYRTPEQDEFLKDCDGYIDKTSKEIVVADFTNKSELKSPEVQIKKNLRHEIIHAFFYESGLWENWEHKKYGHEETTVDYFAIQWCKINRAFLEAGAI